MMRVARYTVLIGTLLGTCVPLAAQTAQDRARQRFWIHVNLGYGTANVSCDSCLSGPRLEGVTGGLELGGTVSPNVRLGGMFEAWRHGTGASLEELETVGAVMYYYPGRSSGFFLKGGLGFSSYNAPASPAVSGTGWGYTAGAGYEVPIGSTVTIMPFVDYVYGNVGDLNSSDGSIFVTGWNQNFVAFGLSFGFYPGSHRY